MALFKCKMCGGTLEINDETVATCEYCGTRQTLPKLSDDRRANLYDRANHFRRNNEFDKAMGIYEQILNDDSTDSESYWSLVLCRYGIEYVEDPVTHKRIPTVNRAQFTSIFDDDNYKSALQYADSFQRGLYEAEARTINEIQKGILAISQKEEPFDVFICYKETDRNGRRTSDSVLANELYHQLTQEGFKVFFSRITLEDKLGVAYEPYIFAALNSAKVMVVLGTKQEYFNAVWVKNEWSRYLALIRNGANKILIPAYRDMDPYDLPDEFSHLQAQDMSKLGFMQDLIRGIRKLALAEAPKQTVVKETVIASGNTNTAPLLKRAFMFLEDGDWRSADEYCEKVLDIDPECAQAYLGKLMAELRVRRQEGLKDCAQPFDGMNNYQKTIRFADGELRAALTGCIDHIEERNEQTRLEGIYLRAKSLMELAKQESAFKDAAKLFDTIAEYQDSGVRAQQCREKAEEARKDAVYDGAMKLMSGNQISNYQEAIRRFETIFDWMDSSVQIDLCRQKIAELEAKKERDRLAAEAAAKRNKKIAFIVTPIICAIIGFIVIRNFVINNNAYKDALSLMEAGQYDAAVAAFEAVADFKDSKDKIIECNYFHAVLLMEAGQYEEAITTFEAIGNYKDSAKKLEDCQIAAKYENAMAALNAEQYQEAIVLFKELGVYKDSAERLEFCYIAFFGEEIYRKIVSLKVGDIVELGTYEQDYSQSGTEPITWHVLDIRGTDILLLSEYVLDYQRYDDEYDYRNMARYFHYFSSSVCHWLNDSFYSSAFTTQEQRLIKQDNPSCNANVFLLSLEEVQNLVPEEIRKTRTTDYVFRKVRYNSTSWALRTIVYVNSDFDVVDRDSPENVAPNFLWIDRGNLPNTGEKYDFGEDGINCNNIQPVAGIRPAIWISLDN